MSEPVSPRRGDVSGWGSRAGLDVTAVTTGYLLFLLAIPATMIVESLGTLGAPATILSLFALVWYAWYHLHRSERITGGSSPARRAGLCFMIVMLVVYGHAMSTFVPGLEVTNADSSLLRSLGMIGLVLVLSDGISTVERWRVLLGRLSTAGALLAVLAIAQFFTHQLLIDHISLPGLTPPQTSDGIGARGMFTRPSGTATNAIEFGAVISMFLPIAFTRAQMATRRRFWAWLPVLLMGFAALVALSRTAIICVVLGMAILVPSWPRRQQIQTLVLAPFALVAAGVAVPGLLGTLRGMFLGAGQDSSVSSRTQSYGVAWSYIQRHPWLGRGYGSFLPKYWILDNAWLQTLIGTGVIGVCALLALLLAAVRSAHLAQRIFQAQARTRGQRGPDPDALLARSTLAAVVAGGVALFFFDGLSFPQSAGCLMLVIGLCGASLRLARSTAAAGSSHGEAPLLAGHDH